MRVSKSNLISSGVDFSKLIPVSEVWTKNVGIRIAAHNAEKNEQRRARRAALASDSFLQKKLNRFDELLQKITDERSRAANDPLSIQHRNIKKWANQLKKVADEIEREEKEVGFGEKSHSLIFVISSIVVRELSELCATQPQQAYKYLTGKDRRYWLTTYTQSLCTSLNKNSLSWETINATSEEKRLDKDFQSRNASFRGKKGLYASLNDAEFIVDKVGTGNKVRLCIDLDWILGFSLNVLDNLPAVAPALEISSTPSAAPLFDHLTRGNSTGFSQIDKSKETEYKESGLATPELVSPTIVGNKKEESEAKSNAPAEISNFSEKKEEKNCAAPRENSDAVALDVATDSANRLLKALFNNKNLKSGKIRFNSTSVCQEISRQDAVDARYWMLDLMRHLKKDDETWTDVAALVNEAIANTEGYLNDHPTRWVYHPKFYLSPSFSTGTLKTYIETFLRERTYEPKEVLPFQNAHTPQVAWLIENGANRESVMRYVRRFGEQVVSDAVAFAGARIAGGFVPTKGKVPYIMGILSQMDPKLIGAQAALEKERVLAKKSAKLMEESDAWTGKKVEKICRNIIRKSDELARCTLTACQKIADRANLQKANIGQIEVWILGHAKGTSPLFN